MIKGWLNILQPLVKYWATMSVLTMKKPNYIMII